MATAHNEPLNFLAEQGAIAFLLYMTFLAYFGYMAVKLRVSTDVLMQSMGGVFLSVLLIYFVYTQIQPIYNFGGGPVFTFVAGMLSTLYYRDKAVSRAYQEL
jgi:O-antigen ligase